MSNIRFEDLEAIAVTTKPGLSGSLSYDGRIEFLLKKIFNSLN
jgi:tRNA A37 threonylcarbamoyltransferase TsaD